MTKRPGLLSIGITASLWLMGACAGEARADSPTLAQEALVSASGRMKRDSTTLEGMASLMGEPTGGAIVNGIFTIRIGYQVAPFRVPPGTRTIAVEGTVDDPTVTIDVNGIQASITGATFRAEGIRLTEGSNTITATATDRANNSGTHRITVILDTRPPARPTVATTAFVTTQTSYTLSGTKLPDTAIWINGTEKVARNSATTWTVTVTLLEGDNDFTIVAKDAAGNGSASNAFNLILDNLPPVLNIAPSTPTKTNLSPLTMKGTVDDSLTQVEANGVIARRSGRNFEVDVPLALGPNTVRVTATSPNNHGTTQNLTITRGTIPTLTSLSPLDAATVYQGVPTTLQAGATDAENDPLEFQFLINGQVLRAWGTSATQTWTPTNVEIHTVEAQVRDGFGGQGAKSVELLVLQKPFFPPAGGAQAPPPGGGGRVQSSRVLRGPGATSATSPLPVLPPPTLNNPTLVKPGLSLGSAGTPANSLSHEPAPAPEPLKAPAQEPRGRHAPASVTSVSVTPSSPLTPPPAATAIETKSDSHFRPEVTVTSRTQTPVESLAPRSPQPGAVTGPASSLTNTNPVFLRPAQFATRFFTIWYRLFLLRDFPDPRPKLAKHVEQQVEIMRQAFRRLTLVAYLS